MKWFLFWMNVKRAAVVTFAFKVVNDSMVLRQAGDVFRRLVESSPMAVLELDKQGECLFANSRWREWTECDMPSLSGLGWTDVLHVDTLIDIWSALGNAQESTEIYKATVNIAGGKSAERWVAMSLTAKLDDHGNVYGFLCVAQDVSTAIGTLHQIQRVAVTDVVTGLLHRSSFLDRLQTKLGRRINRSRLALIYINIGGLKAINTSIGQDAGDEALRLMSVRLLAVVEKDAVCGRLSGSKFAVVLDAVVSPVVLNVAVERLLNSLNESYFIFGNAIRLSISMGVAIGDENQGSSDQLLANARQALAYASESNSVDWMLYTRKLMLKAERKSAFHHRVRKAVELKEFTLEYQPQYRIDSYTVVSFEALLRWKPSDMDSPSVTLLIQTLESIDLMQSVGWWVLEAACQQFMLWNDIGLLADGCTMSVNISPEQLKEARFNEKLLLLLNRYSMLPAQLNLELTESALSDFSHEQFNAVTQLKLDGFQLSLDDFGVGSRSLASLNQLPVDALKIDQSIVNAMENDEPSRNMVRSVLAIAESLEIDVIAGGIENQSTLGELRDAQCHYVQGNVVTKPAPATRLEPLLIRQRYKIEDVLLLS